ALSRVWPSRTYWIRRTLLLQSSWPVRSPPNRGLSRFRCARWPNRSPRPSRGRRDKKRRFSEETEYLAYRGSEQQRLLNMAIEHKRLGKHGVLVSNICLGTMNFGWHTSQEESFKIMDRALELGINFFDTADIYGWGGEQGDTEEILGRWFAQGGGRRDAVVLATKVFNPVKRKANLAEPNTDGRSLSAYKIRKHCEGSLKRLQTDHIDLYQMHHVDRDCPWDET